MTIFKIGTPYITELSTSTLVNWPESDIGVEIIKGTPEVVKEMADLIAGAPDLLSCCKRVHMELSKRGYMTNMVEMLDRDIKNAEPGWTP